MKWFSSGAPVSATIETDRHDIAEILLKVALKTITMTLTLCMKLFFLVFESYCVIIIRE